MEVEDIRNVRRNSKHGLLNTSDVAGVESTLAFESPCLVDECVTLPIIARGLALAVDDKGRIVVLGRRRPLVRHVDLLGIPHNHGTVVLESDGSGPQAGRT